MTPPAGAGPLRVTVPVLEARPIRVAGLRVRVVTTSGSTLRVAVALAPPAEAVMPTGVVDGHEDGGDR